MLRFQTIYPSLCLAISLLVPACGGDDSPAPAQTMDASPSDSAPSTPDAMSTPDDAAAPRMPFDGPSGPSAGCDRADAPKGKLEATVIAARIEREYILVVPDDYDASTPLSLIFAWHGLGGNYRNFSSALQLERTAGSNAIIAYPNGRPSVGGANGWDLSRDGRDVQFFDAMVEEISAAYCIETGSIFTTGFSYGGFFSNTLGCARGDVLRGIAPVAGSPTVRNGCVGQVAALIAHGESDSVVPFSQGETASRIWASQNGCSTESSPGTPSECAVFAGCDSDYPVWWCTYPGGHTYPRFGPSAIWSFFSSLTPGP